MKRLGFVALPFLLAVLTGCATSSPGKGSPYYYGGTSYRMHNIGGLPVSGSIGVSATSTGVMLSPNIVIRPTYKSWKQ